MLNTPSKKIPNDWKTMKMGDLFDFKNGVNADKTQYGSGIRFINVMEIIKHDALTEELIPGRVVLDKKSFEKNRVEYGDVLFNRTSETPEEIGLTSTYLGKEPVVFGGFVIRARARKYCFASKMVRSEIIKRGQGAVRSNIGQEDLCGVSIQIPPASEQDRIVTVLGSWDRAIECLSKKIELKELVKLSLEQEILSGKRRMKGFTDPWKFVRAGDLFKNVTNKNHPNEPLLSATQDRGVIPRSMLSGRVMSPEGDRSSYKLVEPGNFVISLRSFQGGLELCKYRGIVSPAYTVLTEKIEINHDFYRFYFKSHQAIASLDSSVIGIRDGKQVNYSSFKHIKIPYPPLEEQKSIVEMLMAFEQDLNLLRKKLNTIRGVKDYLISHLIAGSIRVPEGVAIKTV
jgi:type I restriction enzyme, S subunit